MKQKQSAGFTLVEIAIVLVIIGLLLGGILKGQELITNAKVRNLADQQNAVKAAFYAFQDRFRALPGDYRDAATNIPNVARSGDGDAQIEENLFENVFVWYHLTNAGFISCSQCAGDPGASPAPSQANSPINAFNGVMTIVFDAVYAVPSGTPSQANNLKSGKQIPSNIIAEVDRKIDDGIPTTGAFRFSIANPEGGTAPTQATCLTGTPLVWQLQTPENNCGGANML